MGHENTNSVPRRGHAAKCHPGLNMLRQARKILSTTQKLTIEKFLPSLLFSVFVECSSIEYLSCSAPDLASFPDTQLGHFPFCKALKEASAGELDFMEHHLCAGHGPVFWAQWLTQFIPRGFLNQEDTDPWIAEKLDTELLTDSQERGVSSLSRTPRQVKQADEGADFWVYSVRVQKLRVYQVLCELSFVGLFLVSIFLSFFFKNMVE